MMTAGRRPYIAVVFVAFFVWRCRPCRYAKTYILNHLVRCRRCSRSIYKWVNIRMIRIFGVGCVCPKWVGSRDDRRPRRHTVLVFVIPARCCDTSTQTGSVVLSAMLTTRSTPPSALCVLRIVIESRVNTSSNQHTQQCCCFAFNAVAVG